MNSPLKAIILAGIGSVIASVLILLIVGWISDFQLTEAGHRMVVALDMIGAIAVAFFILRSAGAGHHRLRRTSR